MSFRVPDSWSNWNLEMLIFEERVKPEYPEKTSRSKGENQQQTLHTYGGRRHDLRNPGQIGGRRALSPLRHPLLPIFDIKSPNLPNLAQNRFVNENFLRQNDFL